MAMDLKNASERDSWIGLFQWTILHSVLSFHEVNSLISTANALKNHDMKPGENFLEAYCLTKYERKDGEDDHSLQEPYRTDGAKSN